MQARLRQLYVFAASFEMEEEAQNYAQACWEPEPDETVSDEEYRAWEDRNPIWIMKEDLGDAYLDEDFIETIWGAGPDEPGPHWDYLSSRLESTADVETCKAAAPAGTNTLILIDELALGGFDFEPHSTPRMTYCGAYPQRN